MIDQYFWNFVGSGHETNAETRVKPNPGYHFYEHSHTRAQRLEELLGIGITHEATGHSSDE
jgi:hypothetical protein